MEARAYLKYARISPRKVQIVLDLIRNKPVDMAMAILKHILAIYMAGRWLIGRLIKLLSTAFEKRKVDRSLQIFLSTHYLAYTAACRAFPTCPSPAK